MTHQGGASPDPNAILASLEAIRRMPTDHGIRSVLAAHPEVLTETGVFLADALVDIQTTPEARETAQELALLVDLCSKRGVDAGIAEYRRQVAELRRRSRVENERRAYSEARQRSLGTPSVLPHWARVLDGRPLASLSECLTELRELFPQSRSEISGHDIDHPSNVIQWLAPKFLYRGESGAYSNTRSLLARLRTDQSVSPDAFEDIVRVAIRARRFLEKEWGLPSLEARAFLQHYRMSTDFVDLTSALEVAVSFATKLAVGQIGALGVFPVEQLLESCVLVDLSNRSLAPRARRQSAYALWSDRYQDWKEPITVDKLAIRWRFFRLSEEDADSFLPDPELLDGHSDPLAGLLQLIVDECDKMDDDAARWLSERLEPAPVTARVLSQVGQPPTWEVISADEAGEPYNREAGQTRNYEAWSERFAASPKGELPEELRDAMVTAADIASDGIVRVLTRRGLGLLSPMPEDPV